MYLGMSVCIHIHIILYTYILVRATEHYESGSRQQLMRVKSRQLVVTLAIFRWLSVLLTEVFVWLMPCRGSLCSKD